MTKPLAPDTGGADTLRVTARSAAQRLAGKIMVGGVLTNASSGRTFELREPATQQPICEIAAADESDIEDAVAAAQAAQKAWAGVPARGRGRLLIEASIRLAEHADELAILLALESGKALRTECRGEAAMVADVLQFFGGLAGELKGDTVPIRPGVLAYTQREPLGVVAAILPWNVPLAMLAIKISPALVAGNTVVVKSAEETPLSVLRAAEILNEVLPAGVLNVLSGDGPGCGAPLVAHPGIAKITFTGSVDTGRSIYSAAAKRIVPVTLELGGKSPMLVLADADIERAASGAIVAMRFTRQGQSCTAASRILVQESIHDAFVELLLEKLSKLVIGDPLDEATDIGAVISQAQHDKVTRYVDQGKQTPGAIAHEVGRLPDDPKLRDGYFHRPVIFTGLDNFHPVVREEIFGPVTVVIPFDEVDQAIDAANDSEFGLTASVWTRDFQTALRAVSALEAGLVQVNQHEPANLNLSFGGIKKSGLGRELTLDSMLEHFTSSKTVVLNFE